MADAAPPLSHLRNPLDLISNLTRWGTENWVVILIALALGFGVYFLLLLVRAFVMYLCRPRALPGSNFLAIVRRAAARTSHIFQALLAARLVVGYTEPPPLLFTTIRFLFIIVAVIQCALWLRELVLGFIEQRANPDEGGSETLANASGLLRVLVNTVLVVVAVIIILDNVGVNVTGLVAGLGIGGIAIGLAAQGIFSDLFAALSILFDRPFKIGETIAYDSTIATVERIGLKSTRLRALTGEGKIISNAKLLEKEITSYAELTRRRVLFAFGIVYHTSPEMSEKLPTLLGEIVETEKTHFVRGGFVRFGASSLDFEVEFDVLSGEGDVFHATRHSIGLILFARLKSLGYEFAYPAQTTFTADPEGKLIMPYPTAARSAPPA